jgi:hypothetical protein
LLLEVVEMVQPLGEVELMDNLVQFQTQVRHLQLRAVVWEVVLADGMVLLALPTLEELEERLPEQVGPQLEVQQVVDNPRLRVMESQLIQFQVQVLSMEEVEEQEAETLVAQVVVELEELHRLRASLELQTGEEVEEVDMAHPITQEVEVGVPEL